MGFIEAMFGPVALGAIYSGLSLSALAADLDAAASRLDVDAVAARLDVDAVAARLDTDALAARFGPAVFANIVLEAVELPNNLISSTGEVDGDAVRRAGKTGAGAYVQVLRVVDRVPLSRTESQPDLKR